MKKATLKGRYAKVSEDYMRALARTQLSSRESRILWATIERTFGFLRRDGSSKAKPEDAISLSQYATLTGLSKSHCSEAVNSLLRRRILSVRGVRAIAGRKVRVMGLNPYLDEWSRNGKWTGSRFPKPGTQGAGSRPGRERAETAPQPKVYAIATAVANTGGSRFPKPGTVERAPSRARKQTTISVGGGDGHVPALSVPETGNHMTLTTTDVPKGTSAQHNEPFSSRPQDRLTGELFPPATPPMFHPLDSVRDKVTVRLLPTVEWFLYRTGRPGLTDEDLSYLTLLNRFYPGQIQTFVDRKLKTKRFLGCPEQMDFKYLWEAMRNMKGGFDGTHRKRSRKGRGSMPPAPRENFADSEVVDDW